MTQQLIKPAEPQGSIADPTALEWTRDQVELLKRTICKGATDDELKLFVHACQRMRLDPFMKQVHAVKRWDSKEKKEVMSIQTGIDGYRLIADRTGKYAGSDEPSFDSESSHHPGRATVTVYKLVDGQRCGFSATARWTEYAQHKTDGKLFSNWERMPYLMLGKCAEALALRKAFPAELSGIYTDDEMGQADSHHAPSSPPKEPKAVKATVKEDESKAEPLVVPDTDPAPDGDNLVPDNLVRVTIQDIRTHSGKGKQGDWTRYGIYVMGPGAEEFYLNTFSDTHGDIAQNLKGQDALVAWEERQFKDRKTGEQRTSRDLTHIEPYRKGQTNG